jgi:hypothetical protein
MNESYVPGKFYDLGLNRGARVIDEELGGEKTRYLILGEKRGDQYVINEKTEYSEIDPKEWRILPDGLLRLATSPDILAVSMIY